MSDEITVRMRMFPVDDEATVPVAGMADPPSVRRRRVTERSAFLHAPGGAAGLALRDDATIRMDAPLFPAPPFPGGGGVLALVTPMRAAALAAVAALTIFASVAGAAALRRGQPATQAAPGPVASVVPRQSPSDTAASAAVAALEVDSPVVQPSGQPSVQPSVQQSGQRELSPGESARAAPRARRGRTTRRAATATSESATSESATSESETGAREAGPRRNEPLPAHVVAAAHDEEAARVTEEAAQLPAPTPETASSETLLVLTPDF